MYSSENPFDQSVWDPANSEQAIEDPLHGPSAVFDMLQVPAMPLGDGTYYQPGGFYAMGSVRTDALGKPIWRVNSAASIQQTIREQQDVSEWLSAFGRGEDALIELEAGRQRDRLETHGVAHSFKDTDVCGGGKPVRDCDTATELCSAAQEYSEQTSSDPARQGEGNLWTELAWLSKRCGSCALSCSVAMQTYVGKPTGIVRFSNTKPHRVIDIDTSHYTIPDL